MIYLAIPNAPTYCTAQNVIDFVGITDDDGNSIVLSEDTDPKLSAVNELIMDEEDKLDNRMGHSWKEKRAIIESLDLPYKFDWFYGEPIHLKHRKIRTIDPEQGDFIRVLYPDENSMDITDKKQQWWRMNYQMGILYMLGYVWYIRREKRLQIKYRYGDEDVPRWLRRATIQSTAITLMETSLSMSKITTQEGVDMNRLIEKWREDIDLAIANNSELQVVAYM